MKIIIGSDHGGYDLKLEIIEHLKERGFDVTDVGCDSDKATDYPIYAKKLTDILSDYISSNNEDYDALGILVCGTGIGMSMAANKVDGIRAALCHDTFSAEATREHNNANVLCMGARVIGPGLALKVVDTFIDTPFSKDERHVRRVSMYS
ncbi:MAG TPA: ribose 5-phosphate isomerase B [Lachnospiraceae bacterium]|nr:ribose 5-phosphate isomerase B [Lachnospiraceae bacterium]